MPPSTRSSVRRSGGFTIIELIVTISVISLLTALILPAVQSSREASLRGLPHPPLALVPSRRRPK